jgi:hypothetical protein
MIDRDRIEAELREIELLLADADLKDEDRAALHGASQALRHILDPATWHPPSQTFYAIAARPKPSPSDRQH